MIASYKMIFHLFVALVAFQYAFSLSPGAVLCLIDDDVDDSGQDANCDSHGGDGRLNLGVTAW